MSLASLQHILSATVAMALADDALTSTNVNATLPSPSWDASPPPHTDSWSLLRSFFRQHAWIVLLFMSQLSQTFMYFMSSHWNRFVELIFMNAYFADGDASYEWMLLWLSKQPAWKNVREVEIRTSNGATWVESSNSEAPTSASRQVGYIPSVNCTYSLRFRRRWINIVRTQDFGGDYNRKENKLKISILFGSNAFLHEILLEARRMYAAEQEHQMSIYTVDRSCNTWRHASTRPKRSLNSIILDRNVKDTLIEDARSFLESKRWYADRGIPFRRGYLLYGVPGSGKTSLIHGVAGELGLDVYVATLSQAAMDDAMLGDLMNNLPERCIMLIEDLDAVFTHNIGDRQSIGNISFPGGQEQPRLSLGGLLNAIDGIGAQEGRIMFATTNHIEALDPALIRPGRMDLHIKFTHASKYQAEELFRRFYLPCGPEEHCDEDDLETLIDENLAPGGSKPRDSISSLSADAGVGRSSQQPKISRKKIDWLAHQFAETVPEGEFSMAGLQGHLMKYKAAPLQAVLNMSEWIEEEMAKRKVKDTREKILATAEGTWVRQD